MDREVQRTLTSIYLGSNQNPTKKLFHSFQPFPHPFNNSTGHRPTKSEIDVPLIYADYLSSHQEMSMSLTFSGKALSIKEEHSDCDVNAM